MQVRWWFVPVIAAVASCQGCPPENELNALTANVTCLPEGGLNFGTVDIAQSEKGRITLSNTGARNADEIVVTLLPESDPAFSLVTPTPTVVEPGTDGVVEVRVQPLVAAQISGRVNIRGRLAEADPRIPEDQQFFECNLPITATAVDNGLPDIDCTPSPVEFGRVGQGDVGRQTLTCRNNGIRDLIIEELRLDRDASSPFSTSTQIPSGTTFRPADSFTVALTCNPLDTDTHTATLHILSNDLDERDLEIPMTCAGQVAPTCRVELLDDISDLEPETTVRLNGIGETTIQDAYIAHYLWSLSYRPPGSTTSLESQGAGQPRGQELDVVCGEPGVGEPCSTRIDMLADLAGTYEVTLVVEDSVGIRSAPCSQRFRATPKEQLHVQLVWDHPTADLDLHFMRGENPPAFNHLTDCYFSNRFPVWFGADASDPRNPRLDVDDQGGFGPENVNVTSPEPGPYRLAVHYWNSKTQGDPATLATLRVYVRGQLALEQTQFFTQDQVMWNVADLVWPIDVETAPTINPINDVQNYPRPF